MKKRLSLVILTVVMGLNVFASNVKFEDYFMDKTMRVDYFHNGNSEEEHFSIDRIVSDRAWGGSTIQLIDQLEFGLYFFEIQDAESGNVIYNRGFASIFGEWQTIPEAAEKWGTFHESIRFPWPLKPVNLVMKKRNAKNTFDVIWKTEIDPSSRSVNPADLASKYKVYPSMVNGDAKEKVDIVILGDGYTAEEMNKFHADIDRLTAYLFSVEPFKSRKQDFNVRGVETPSARSGVHKPHPGVHTRTPLGIQYSSFDSERYALSYDNKAIRDAASEVPYEFMYVLINERTYGGGGIYQLYATVAVDNKFSDYIFVHELGHHMAALADEYYSSSVSYQMPEITIEPWEANITALLDKDNLKWKELVKEDTPIPTPWDKEKFDKHGMEIQAERQRLRAAKSSEEVLEALFERQRQEETRMIKAMKHTGDVGAFEGASYYQHGMYRSSTDCIMYTRNGLDFCPVCQKAISEVINQYTK